MYVLRDYQEEAVSVTLDDLITHDKLGIIAPTGAGKTVMMLEIAERMLKKLGTGYHVIIVSHLSLLQSQTLQGFEKHSKYMTTRFQASEQPAVLSRIIITTMQTLRNDRAKDLLHKKLLHNKTALILIDEAQMYGSNSYKKIVERYPGAKVIGFSASPYRGNRYSFNQFDKVSYSISLQELIDKGFLVKPVLHEIPITKAMTIEQRINLLIATFKEHKIDKGAIVYWNTKEDAMLAASAFDTCEISSVYLTDKTPVNRRKKVLKGFDEGKYQVIHNVNILSAGYDSPYVYNIFMPMGTNSPVNYIQRIGRGLRLAEGKTHCNVYCFGDAPTIKRDIYRRIHRLALRVKDDPDWGKQGDIYDKLDWLTLQEKPQLDKIAYMRDVVEIHKRIKDMGATNLSRLIRFQKFPKRYLRSLVTKGALDEQLHRDKITETQQKWLDSKNIPHIGLSNGEAKMLIAMIQRHQAQPWIVRNGLHENKRINEVPMAYIGALIKKKNFKHPVVKLYLEWKKQGKPT